MKLNSVCLTALILAFPGVILAQPKTINQIESTARPVGAALATPSKEQPEIERAPMPTDRLEKPIPLDEELEAIRNAIAGFNSVVVRDAGVPADYPTLPVMTLKNVTVGQFLQFVQVSYPGVQCMRIDGPSGSLYSIRIRPDSQKGDANRVRLYGLKDVIKSMTDATMVYGQDGKAVNSAEAVKEATAQVLSLLQAALEQTDPDGPMTLKIHEPTLTLMFKGSNVKQNVLEEALSTLQPGPGRPRLNRFGSSGGSGASGRSNAPWETYPSSLNTASSSDPFDALQQRRATELHIAKMQEDMAKRQADMEKSHEELRAKMNQVAPTPTAPPATPATPAQSKD